MTTERPAGIDICHGRYYTVARLRGRIIGVHSYRIYGRQGARTLRSCETWVASSWRKRGIAKRLWRRSLTRRDICRVRVTVISVAGFGLVCSLTKKFRHFLWKIEADIS